MYCICILVYNIHICEMTLPKKCTYSPLFGWKYFFRLIGARNLKIGMFIMCVCVCVYAARKWGRKHFVLTLLCDYIASTIHTHTSHKWQRMHVLFIACKVKLIIPYEFIHPCRKKTRTRIFLNKTLVLTNIDEYNALASATK